MLSRVLTALTAVLLLSVTAACGSDGPAGGEASGEPPAHADNPGEAGAEQFVGYWTDTLNEATTSGDTKQLRSLATDQCTACSDFASQLDKIYGAGGHVESEGWTVERIVSEAGATENEVGLLVTYDVSPQKVWQAEDAKPQTFRGGKQGFRFHLVRADGEWQVQDLSPR